MPIRDATPADRTAIRAVITAAFGQPAEADLVDALHDSGDAMIALVAEQDGDIVGHILFSRLQTPAQCIALAPVAVTAQRQRRGVGSRLVRTGLARARDGDWRAVFVLGEPQFYRRFGFTTERAASFETPYPRAYFMALELSPGALDGATGPVVYAPAFAALG